MGRYNPTVVGGNLKLVVVAATFSPIDYSPLSPLNKTLTQGCVFATLILTSCVLKIICSNLIFYVCKESLKFQLKPEGKKYLKIQVVFSIFDVDAARVRQK